MEKRSRRIVHPERPGGAPRAARGLHRGRALPTMTNQHGERKRGLPERDVPQPGRSTHSAEARDRPKPDPHASPLGRQAPADAARDTAPLSGGSSVSGRRGADAVHGKEGRGDEMTSETDAATAPPLDSSEIGGGKARETARSGEEAA